MDDLLRRRIVKGAASVANEARRIISKRSRRVGSAISVQVKGDLISVETDASVDGEARAWAGGIRHPLNWPNQRRHGETHWGSHPRVNYMERAWTAKIDDMQDQMAAWTADLTKKKLGR
jgi:hypothetical protein